MAKTKKEFNTIFKNAIDTTLFKEPLVIVAVVSMELYYAPIAPIGTSADNMKYLYDSDSTNIKIDNCRVNELK